MVEFNKERTIKRLKALGYLYAFVELELTAISNLHSDLQGVFDAWLEGIEKEYEVKGVSLSQIKEKEGCDHLNALSTMSMFINDPSSIELFQSVSADLFRRHCGAHRMGAA